MSSLTRVFFPEGAVFFFPGSSRDPPAPRPLPKLTPLSFFFPPPEEFFLLCFSGALFFSGYARPPPAPKPALNPGPFFFFGGLGGVFRPFFAAFFGAPANPALGAPLGAPLLVRGFSRHVPWCFGVPEAVFMCGGFPLFPEGAAAHSAGEVWDPFGSSLPGDLGSLEILHVAANHPVKALGRLSVSFDLSPDQFPE